jgi:hypothetical protein
MKKITFLTPNGEDIENPSEEILENFIYEKDETYWNSNAGDAGLWYDENDSRKAELNIVFEKNYGFRFIYSSYQDNMDYLLKSGNNLQKEISLYVGGEPVKYSADDFVNEDIAWQVIKEFLSSGNRNPKFQWKI